MLKISVKSVFDTHPMEVLRTDVNSTRVAPLQLLQSTSRINEICRSGIGLNPLD